MEYNRSRVKDPEAIEPHNINKKISNILTNGITKFNLVLEARHYFNILLFYGILYYNIVLSFNEILTVKYYLFTRFTLIYRIIMFMMYRF